MTSSGTLPSGYDSQRADRDGTPVDSLDVTGGSDYVIEITGSTPIWNAGSGTSTNDLLRLTGTAPFVGSFTSGNVIDVLFNLTTGTAPASAGSFTAGFFTDQNTNFDCRSRCGWRAG